MSSERNKNTDQDKFLKLLQERNPEAMEIMYDQFAPILYGVACRIVKDEANAEEILKKTFLHIWEHYADFDPSKQNICLWMIGIVKSLAQKKMPFNTFIENRGRSNYVDTGRMDQQSDGASDSGMPGDKNSLMTPEQKEVLDLVFLGGGKINEVAKHLGVDENKVKQLLHEAVNHYRKEMQEL